MNSFNALSQRRRTAELNQFVDFESSQVIAFCSTKRMVVRTMFGQVSRWFDTTIEVYDLTQPEGQQLQMVSVFLTEAIDKYNGLS